MADIDDEDLSRCIEDAFQPDISLKKLRRILEKKLHLEKNSLRSEKDRIKRIALAIVDRKRRGEEASAKSEAESEGEMEGKKEVSSKKTTKKKKKKGPKRALSAYVYFTTHHRASMKASNPEATNPELMKLLAAKWKNATTEEKQFAIELHDEDVIRADKEKAEWVDSDPDSGEEEQVKKKKKGPKRAVSAYVYFTTHHRASMKASNPEAKNPELMKLLAAKWKNATTEEKQFAIELHEEDVIRADKEKAEWKLSNPKNGNTKSKKKLVDPNAPKKPRSSYLLYTMERRSFITTQQPELKSSEIMKVLGKEWREMSDEKKSLYKDKANEDKKRYDLELSKYTKPDWMIEAQEAEDKLKKPKRPCSAYLYFSKENRSSIAAKFNGIKNAQVMEKVAAEWNLLSDDDKSIYVEKAQVDKERYLKEKAIWDEEDKKRNCSSNENHKENVKYERDEKSTKKKKISSKHSNSKTIHRITSHSGGHSPDSKHRKCARGKELLLQLGKAMKLDLNKIQKGIDKMSPSAAIKKIKSRLIRKGAEWRGEYPTKQEITSVKTSMARKELMMSAVDSSCIITGKRRRDKNKFVFEAKPKKKKKKHSSVYDDGSSEAEFEC